MQRVVKVKLYFENHAPKELTVAELSFGLRQCGYSLEWGSIKGYCMDTGLKDKQGNQIYEGDIVQVVDRDGKGLSKFRIEWNQSSCSFVKMKSNGETFPLDKFQTLLQKIGNIYEHAELLN